jgi:hypothetical protein
MDNFWIEKTFMSLGVNSFFKDITLDYFLNLISICIIFIILVGYATEAKYSYYIICFIVLTIIFVRFCPIFNLNKQKEIYNKNNMYKKEDNQSTETEIETEEETEEETVEKFTFLPYDNNTISDKKEYKNNNSFNKIMYNQPTCFDLEQGKKILKDKILKEETDRYLVNFSGTQDQLQYSRNYAMTKPGGRLDANYKTKIPPIIPPRSLDLDAWKNNDLTTLSIVNNERNQDLYQSGYISKHEIPFEQKYQSINQALKPNEYSGYQSKIKLTPEQDLFENSNFENEYPSVQNVKTQGYFKPKKYIIEYKGRKGDDDYEDEEDDEDDEKENFMYEGYEGYETGLKKNSSLQVDKKLFLNVKGNNYNVKRDVDIIRNKNGDEITPGDIITSSGYNQDNLKYNLPSNYSFGSCENDKDYNKNIYTNYVDPNVFTNSQIIEPISSNIGISFDQQIPPTTVKQNKKGNVIFQSYDPRMYSISKFANTHQFDKPQPDISNIYDPRFEGYGDNSRYYYDKMSSTNNFAYDDIDAYKRPNFIIRSKIDHLPASDSYGPMGSDDEIRSNNFNTNQVAIKSYLDNSLMHRNELQERLMRKRNSEMWQTRKYPKHTMGMKFT